MFFDKPVWKLTLAQQALLAGLPQAPSQYNPFIDKGAARAPPRRGAAGDGAGRLHHPGAGQASQPRSHCISSKTTPTCSAGSRTCSTSSSIRSPRICVRRQPNNCPTLNKGGLKIYTTIDLRKQALAEQAIANNYTTRAEQGGPGVAAAGLASIDPAERPHRGDRHLGQLQPDQVRLRRPRPTASRDRRSRCSR